MFFSSTIAFLIALTSPGPDTAIIINQCSKKGRAAGIYTAIGIGSGILIHCILAVTGISLLVVNYPPIKIFISLIGGAYIFYICLLYTSPSPRDATLSRMPSSA